MQIVLNLIKNWSLEEGLKVSPSKTTIVPFTKRRKLLLAAPTLRGARIDFSSKVKYLGVNPFGAVT